MKILVLGGNGMLGHKVVQVLNKDHRVFATVRAKSSVSELIVLAEENQIFDGVEAEEFQTVETVVETLKPNVIVNCIGIVKQLPAAENIVKTLTVNSIFPHLLRKLSQQHNARLITLSTDCVFNGRKGFYSEADKSDAEDVYGKSKNLGEVAGGNSLTLRTSIIGRELKSNHSLVEWFLGKRDEPVKGFSKAIYSGFPTIVLADIIKNLIENHPQLSGLYHVASEPINKYDLLCLVRDAYGLDTAIERDEDFQINRSLNSTRFRTEINYRPPDWKEMVEMMAADPLPYAEIRKQTGAANDKK